MTQDKPSATPISGSAQRSDATAGKIIPPSSPIDVPNMPAPVKAASDVPQSGTAMPDPDPLAVGVQAPPVSSNADEGAAAKAPRTSDTESPTSSGGPRKIDPTTSSWADSTQPAPDKKNVRSSII